MRFLTALAMAVVTVSAAAGLAWGQPATGDGLKLHAWTHPVALKLAISDCGDKAPIWEKTAPIVIVGAKGGVYSGQVVISSPEPLTEIKVTVADLKADKGGGVIPASAVQVRYALLDGIGDYWREPTFDGLDAAPPEEVKPHAKATFMAVQPIWVTVRVPRDAQPGQYASQVTVSVKGLGERAAPLQLKVHDWTIPEPKDFATEPGFTQSPESVAMQYQAPLWSDKHFALLAQSLQLLGEVGTKAVYITAIAKTNFGNDHGMVRWVKQADGSLKPDFAIVEKYLDLVVKHMGAVPVVVFYAWDIDLGSTMFYAKTQVSDENIKGATVSVLDPKTNELSYTTAPKPGTPESQAFWKPAFDGMREVLKKRGLEKSFLVGTASDMRPNKLIVGDFKAVAPDVPWACCSHGFANELQGQPTRYVASVWGSGRPTDPAKKRMYGWQEKTRLIMTFGRSGCGGIGKLSPGFPLAQHRLALEGCLAGGIRGYMRFGADFWPVFKNDRGRAARLVDRFFGWGGLSMTDTNTCAILAPGKDGPVATERYEMFRECAQECAARISIEKALLDPASRARLGEEAAKGYQAMLDERTLTLATEVAEGKCTPQIAEALGRKVIPERSEKLYAAAAEVAKKLGPSAATQAAPSETH
ncbi:MAG: DUF6067 family protein [Phycisphaerae bacterium]|nr:DUF6067 family protein [Phycisphaerae bacterium]